MKKKFLLCILLALLLAASPLALAESLEEDSENGAPIEEETPVSPEETPGEEEPPSPAPEETQVPEPEETQVPKPEPALDPAPTTTIPGVVAVPEDPAFFSEERIVSVSVPDSGWVVVNPYHLEIDRGGEVSTEAIVSPVMTMENRGTVDVEVTACAVGTAPAGSEAVFVSAPPEADEPEKAVFLFLEFQNDRDAWRGRFSDGANQLLVTENGESKTDLLTLEAGREGYFKLFGGAAESPVDVWTAEDVIKVSVAFTFTLAE